jgi:hypothetical protein
MYVRITRSVLVVLLLTITAASATDWIPATPTMRCAARMALDSAHQRIIMFGGTTVFFDGKYYNDVWQIPLDVAVQCLWTRLAVGGTPPQRRDDVSMVYDPVGNRMIIFGGSAGLGSRLNDVWALNLTRGSETWQQLSPSGTPPSPRHFCYYIYDPARLSLVVFGGEDSAGAGDLNDVWELSLGSLVWHQIKPSGTQPSPRMDGGAAFDGANNRMIIFGGRPGSGFTNEVWALSLVPGSEHWTQLSPAGNGPSARAGFAYAQGGQKLFVSCGWGGSSYYNDLYALDIPSLTWSRINPGGDAPLARRNTTGGWDDAASRFLVFGGEADRGYYLSDLYAVDCAGMAEWVQPQPQAEDPLLSVAGIASGSVRIHCVLTQNAWVTVKIADASGRLIREAYAGTATRSGINLEWDGLDARGHSVPTGVYYCSVETGGTTLSRKFVFAR